VSGRVALLSRHLSRICPDTGRERPDASHWKTETEEKIAEKYFLNVSFKTRMYN